jgi:hypothetical protein
MGLRHNFYEEQASQRYLSCFPIMHFGKGLHYNNTWQAHEKGRQSENAVEQTKNFMSHNFAGVTGIPGWCNDIFVAKMNLKEDYGPSI